MKRRVLIVWQLTRFERAAALAAALALLVAVPVLAAYLGPDRSYTYTETELEKVRDESKDQWTLTHIDPLDAYSDTCISNSSCDAIPNIGWQREPWNCGWIADNASCELGYSWVETIIVKTGTHPAATVSGSVTCGTNGANGWCLNSATLNITGSEPLAGETITGIEGELDGTPFFCGGNTCAVPGSNGQSDAEYWALSSWGDSSLKDTETLKLDLDLPTLDGLIAGTPGNGGWYVSDVTLTADASDATSGLDFAQVRVDGGGWINNSTTLSTDGQYSVEFRAQDLAGQSVSVPAADVWVDATPPDVSLTPSGAAGLAGWYVSDVDVTLAASDATSGLSATQLRVDGGGWQAVGGVTLGEGVYTVDGEALDLAGNYNATSLDVKVDTTAPALNVTESGTPGDGGWYTSASVTVNASASDATSGVADIQMQTDGAGYASATSQIVSGEGSHSVDTTASDAAGNSSSDSRVIRIDSVSPALSLTSHNTSSIPDESGWVTVTGAVSDATSGPSSVQFSSDGGGSWDTVSVDGGGGFDIGWDSTSVRNGEVTLRVRPVDEAGNVGSVTSFTIYVKNEKPYVSLPAGCVAVWDPYAIDAGGGSNPLDGLGMTVSDPEGRWPARDYSFSSVPESWSWDRQFGDGTAAPPGEYDVTVTARDTVGNTTARTGCIVIPDPDAAAVATTTDIETTDPLDEDDSQIGGTPPDTTGDAPTTPALPSLQKAMVDPTGAPVTTKIAAPESGAQIAEAARLALATAANAPAWGDAALFLAALATAYGLSRKQEREAEEAARLADLAMRAERRAMERHADDVMGGEVYVVQSGDSWFSIAGDVYGNQRMAGQLMDANGGGGPLYPGDKILLPPKKKDDVADPYFSQKTWETAQAITATTQHGQEQILAQLLEALARSEHAHQIYQEGDPSVQGAKAVEADLAHLAQQFLSGELSLEEVQSLVVAQMSQNLVQDLNTTYSQTAGVDLESTGKALEAVYASHGYQTPWEIGDYENYLALSLVERLGVVFSTHDILEHGDPSVGRIGEIQREVDRVKSQLQSGELSADQVALLVQQQLGKFLSEDLSAAWHKTEGDDLGERGKALEQVFAAYGLREPWAETGFDAYMADIQEASQQDRANAAWAARYQGMADNWQEISSSWMREIDPQEIMYANYRPWVESYMNPPTPYAPYSVEYWQGQEFKPVDAEGIMGWVDEHQTQLAIGVGIVAGLTAIALTGGAATPLVAAAWAALAAGATAGLGTVALNAYYDRELNQNLIKNVGTAAGIAFAVGYIAPVFWAGGQQIVAVGLRNYMLPIIARQITLSGAAFTVAYLAPNVAAGIWALSVTAGTAMVLTGIAHGIDPTLNLEDREFGANIGVLGYAVLETSFDYYDMAESVSNFNAFQRWVDPADRPRNPIPEEYAHFGIDPVIESAIARSLKPGEFIGLRSRALGAAVASGYAVPQKPVKAKTILELPEGFRWVQTEGGGQLISLSDVDLAFGISSDGTLADRDQIMSLGRDINLKAGYPAIQHGDQANGSIYLADSVPAYPLFEDIMVLGYDGYLETGPFLYLLKEYAGQTAITSIYNAQSTSVQAELVKFYGDIFR